MNGTGRLETRLIAWLGDAPAPHFLGEVALLGPDERDAYELRHRDDLEKPASALAAVADLPALREIVKADATGNFRPLRGAPTLRPGWRLGPLMPGELLAALNVLYPVALAFWAAQKAGTLAVTGFPETARRQTGMYRIVQIATASQLERAVAEVCEKGCLRCRLWQSGPASSHRPLGAKADELPLLCPEACNYFVAQLREQIVREREEEE